MTSHILFFDIDGTMLSTGGAGQKAMELALVEEFRLSFPFENVLTAGRTDRGIEDEIFGKYRLPDTPHHRERFMRAYLDRLPACMKELTGALLPGVRELLQTLHQRPDVHLSLLTGNYREGAWIKLRHFEIDNYFPSVDAAGYGDHHAHRDDVARLALRSVSLHFDRQVPGHDTCVIGDTPADIQCARAIGARAAAVATGVYSRVQLEPHMPDHLFDDLSQIDQVVDRLLTKIQN